VFDVNLRQHDCSEETIEKSLKLANALKLNDGELPLVARAVRTNSQPEEFAKSMIERFELRLLMLTAGEKGSFLFTATESSYVEAAEVEVIDTIGAGDAFAAAAVMGLIGNRPLADFHQQASDYASGVCTTAGAMPKSTID
jgi:fructokinase